MRIDFTYSYWDYGLGKNECGIAACMTTDNYQISSFSELNMTSLNEA